MATFRKIQEKRQVGLMNTEVFDNDPGRGVYRGYEREFVLQDGMHNLYGPIRENALKYFSDNKISWWDTSTPTGHTLSSQIACLNHLFAIRNDKDAVLALLNGVRDEFEDVLPIPCDAQPAYIAFEVVSDNELLNEGKPKRGSQCTSVDAFIYAVHRGDHKKWLIPIEWKYVEQYANGDKSTEDRPGDPKVPNGRGKKRLDRYSGLIDASTQLKSLQQYQASVYYQEPFYQLMRQTLLVENMVKNSEGERLVAEDYLHIHVIPKTNSELLNRPFKVSGMTMEATWRSMLADQTKYVIVDPADLMRSISERYPDLCNYLSERYF
jgi:hypothetical protein